MFVGWSVVSFTPYVTERDRRLGGPLADALGPRFGWFVGIRAKP